MEGSLASWLNPLDSNIAREHVHLSNNPYLQNLPYGLSCFDTLHINRCQSLRRFHDTGLTGNRIRIADATFSMLPAPTTAYDRIDIHTHGDQTIHSEIRTPYLGIYHDQWCCSPDEVYVRFDGKKPSIMQLELGFGVDMKSSDHPMVPPKGWSSGMASKIYRHPDLRTTWRSFGQVVPAEHLVAKARRKFNIPKVELQRN